MKRRSKDLSPIQAFRQSMQTVNKESVRTIPKRARKKVVYAQVSAEYRAETLAVCAKCGRGGKLDIHHKIGRTGSRLWDKRYFALLCRSCHDWVHNNVAESRQAGLLMVLTSEEERTRDETLL